MASKKAKNKLAKRKLSEAQIRKRKIRASPEWAELRERIREEQKCDPISLKPLNRSFNLHHLSQDENYYDDLSPERFVGLNSYSHDCIHYLYNIVEREGDYNVLDRVRLLIIEMQKITSADASREDVLI